MTKEKWYNLTQIKFALFLQCVNTYTLFKIKHSKNNSYKKDIETLIYMFAV